MKTIFNRRNKTPYCRDIFFNCYIRIELVLVPPSVKSDKSLLSLLLMDILQDKNSRNKKLRSSNKIMMKKINSSSKVRKLLRLGHSFRFSFYDIFFIYFLYSCEAFYKNIGWMRSLFLCLDQYLFLLRILNESAPIYPIS